MGIVGALELPARINPCLRLFIEMLFDEVSVKHGGSLYQKGECNVRAPKTLRVEGGEGNAVAVSYEHNSRRKSR